MSEQPARAETTDGLPAGATVPMVRLEGVRKSFGDNLVLDGIDLSVDPGEVLVVIGPSGSGKSTLLRCVNLLEPIQAGRIYLEGEEITRKGANISAIRQRIGIVFQQFNLFPHLTALDNLTRSRERFDAVREPLLAIDPSRVARIDAGFDALRASLNAHADVAAVHSAIVDLTAALAPR